MRTAALLDLPILRDAAEDRVFFAGHIVSGATTVALDGDRPLGFVVIVDSRVEHLYVHPRAQRRKVGTLLLRHAQAQCSEGFDVWVFQRNGAAIAFYEAHGFATVETTDGEDNEEHEPDVRMAGRALRMPPADRCGFAREPAVRLLSRSALCFSRTIPAARRLRVTARTDGQAGGRCSTRACSRVGSGAS